MGSYRRIYRKKLKKSDEIVTASSNILIFFHKNSKSIIFITLIILISVSSWAGFNLYKNKLNETINKEIYNILKEPVSLKEIPQHKIDKVKITGKKYLSKNAYPHIYLGHFYYKNGKYEEAIKEYKGVLEAKSSPLMKENAAIGIGYSYEALGRYMDAINTFTKFIKENESSLMNKEELYVSLGRFYEELGDYKSASEKYQYVIDKFSNLRNIEEIKEKAKKLRQLVL